MRSRLLAAIVIAAALAGAAFFVRHRSSHAPLVAASYVDPATCAGCHSDISQTYSRTGMARSFYRPSRENVKPTTFYHKASDSYFTTFERDGRFFQRRYQIGFNGKQTNSVEKQVDYVVGSGNHVRAYLHRTGRNTLIELPLAWYAENEGSSPGWSWAMNPGYDRPDHPGFTRNITNACMFCHNGIPSFLLGSTEAGRDAVFPDQMPQGIDCQRCHGPGSRHVQLAENGAKADALRGSIVNPARLSPDRQMDVCMQCHLETTSSPLPNAIVRYERESFSYKPGEPLSDFVLQFDHAPGTGHEDKFEIAGAAYRLRRSACFLKSEGRLQCTTCHNPHDIPRGNQAAQHYAGVCKQCHGAAVAKLIAAATHTKSDDCAGCHMPKRRTDDVVHAVMTDHYIQRRKPERDLLAPLTERRETDDNRYRGEVVFYYPQAPRAGRERDLYWAVAQVSQKSNLSEGIPALAAAIEKYKPENFEFYLHLGDAFSNNGELSKALPVYEEAARRKPDSLVALRKWAFSLRSTGQPERAVEILKRALAIGPDATAWHELGLAYVALHSRDEAVAAFEKAADLDEDMAEPYNSLGAVWLENQDLSRAEPAFREAIRRQPDYAEARSNLANVLSANGRFEEAKYHFEAAIRMKPEYAAARYNYAIALARVKRFSEAQSQVEAELKFIADSYPGAAEAHDLLANLLVGQGKIEPAVQEYERAITLQPNFGRAHLDLGSLLAESGDVRAALPHLQEAAASPDPAVSTEAHQMLHQIGNR
ncbi:MAG: tetratricopeptide repeat protein [Bryobacterales bacterium]|nr:tetratricopeptide repeat protein [Bryobacterales bacterium]MBV9399688.1 tetratricopeptide repeat protein [Bryobacterales bacterium]